MAFLNKSISQTGIRYKICLGYALIFSHLQKGQIQTGNNESCDELIFPFASV